MHAFNARLQQKEMFGVPLPGVIVMGVALMFGFAVLPTWGTLWSYITLTASILAGVIAMVIIASGDEFPYLRFRIANARDLNSRTSEAVELE